MTFLENKMRDKIIITDLVATGIIGVEHPERDNPQSLLINVVMFTDLSHAGRTDNYLDLVSYSHVAKTVLREVAATQFYTVEALARHLAETLLNSYAVEAVQIRVEKPNRVVSTARVGVEIYRTRADLAA